MTKTEDFLKAAFAGESQANRKYLAFAEKADKEGFAQVARFFRAAAAAETVHAHNHLRALNGIGSTRDNLVEAIAGETHEFTMMYPEMIEAAKAEGHKVAEMAFLFASKVEEVHAAIYSRLLEELGGTQENYDYYVCPVCGFTAGEHAPDKCPVCGAKGALFIKVD